jgi:hypothetical protein
MELRTGLFRRSDDADGKQIIRVELEAGWGAVEKETPVRMLTIDEFCQENGVAGD